MPLIETKGAASAQGFGEFAQQTAATYIEDVFSTWLYTGNGGTQTITNGIDLSTKGGLVWIRDRTNPANYALVDTVRGGSSRLSSNLSDAADTNLYLSAFNTTGFTIGTNNATVNQSGDSYVSWTFREQPKFFDIVSYTGNGANRTIAHNLGSVPGCIMVKRINVGSDWQVYHRSLANTEYLVLNNSAVKATGTTRWNSTTPTATEFSLGTDSTVNANGGSYIAYLFAHNAGGFGLSGTDNVISCGSFTADANGYANVSLGYEPQWIMYKYISGAPGSGGWGMNDVMRGMPSSTTTSGTGNATQRLLANDGNNADGSETEYICNVTSTGFTYHSTGYANGTFIYIAIRRGPMKVPTSGTSVFTTNTYTGTGAARTITTGFVTDLVIGQRLDDASGHATVDRLRGDTAYLETTNTSAEAYSNGTSQDVTGFDVQTGYTLGVPWNSWMNNSGSSCANWAFRRAPGFFDVVCYTGNGSTQAVTHNLGVAPEIIIVKNRTSARDWFVYLAPLGVSYRAFLNSTVAATNTGPESAWGNNSTTVAPTSTQFTVGTYLGLNASGENLVAYLFATVAGVSKVGSYTGTGALQTVNCGFTGGARFVLIKRTDSTGDWYVYDSARGISSGNDPYITINSVTAEVTGTNYVDTTSVGFQVTAAAPAGLNANGGTYIFLAIA